MTNITISYTAGLAGPVPGDDHFAAVLNTIKRDEHGRIQFATSQPVFQVEMRSLDPQRATLNEARAVLEACLTAEGWEFDQGNWEDHRHYETLEIDH